MLFHSCRRTTVSTHLLLQLHCNIYQLCCLIVGISSFSFPSPRGIHNYNNMTASILLIWLQVYSIEVSENNMFGVAKHNPLLFRLKLMTVS